MQRRSVAKGLIAGLAAGVAATFAMDQFQAGLASAQKADKRKKLADGETPWLVANEMAQQEMQQREAEGSTVKVAEAAAGVVGKTIAKEDRAAAGQAVHYTFGTLMGIVYSVTAELLPEVTTGGGTAFATLLFLGGDEVAVPALKLSGPPTDMPASDHLQYWAAHLVYGGTLELTRSLLRRVI